MKRRTFLKTITLGIAGANAPLFADYAQTALTVGAYTALRIRVTFGNHTTDAIYQTSLTNTVLLRMCEQIVLEGDDVTVKASALLQAGLDHIEYLDMHFDIDGLHQFDYRHEISVRLVDADDTLTVLWPSEGLAVL